MDGIIFKLTKKKIVNMVKWKELEFIWFIFILFGIVIIVGNSDQLTNFPNNLGWSGMGGLALLVFGAYGIYKAES